MTIQLRARRCVCGRSTRLPLCDGSHRSEGWFCDGGREGQVDFVFVASDNLRNLSDRLANRFAGRAMHELSDAVSCERLVVLADGQDMGWITRMSSKIVRQETLVLCVGVTPSVLQWAFPDDRCIGVGAETGPLLWAQVEAAISTGKPLEPSHRPRVFLSHAVADEATLFPVVEALREYFGLRLFVCADSIPPGSQWHREILREAQACDLFLFVNSVAASTSSFCAFEAGIAVALNKHVHVVSLDGTNSPAHLHDIQAIDAIRLRDRKPWLTSADAVLEAFLIALEPTASFD